GLFFVSDAHKCVGHGCVRLGQQLRVTLIFPFAESLDKLIHLFLHARRRTHPPAFTRRAAKNDTCKLVPLAKFFRAAWLETKNRFGRLSRGHLDSYIALAEKCRQLANLARNTKFFPTCGQLERQLPLAVGSAPERCWKALIG